MNTHSQELFNRFTDGVQFEADVVQFEADVVNLGTGFAV